MGRSAEDSQGFQPELGNPAVRDYRGASGNVAMVEMRSRLAYRKSESGNPPPIAGAPELYPNRAHGSVSEALPEETGSQQIGGTYGAPRQSSTLQLPDVRPRAVHTFIAPTQRTLHLS